MQKKFLLRRLALVPFHLCLVHLFLIKVEAGELAMEFTRGFVISFGGFYLIVEVAEVVGFVIAPYRGGPFFSPFSPADAFVS